MALKAPITVKYGFWSKISSAGEGGTCWIWDTGDGSTRILIAHTDQIQTHGTPIGDNIPVANAVGLYVDRGIIIRDDGSVSPALSADNSSDIYYATKLDNDNNDVTLIADFI